MGIWRYLDNSLIVNSFFISVSLGEMLFVVPSKSGLVMLFVQPAFNVGYAEAEVSSYSNCIRAFAAMPPGVNRRSRNLQKVCELFNSEQLAGIDLHSFVHEGNLIRKSTLIKVDFKVHHKQ